MASKFSNFKPVSNSPRTKKKVLRRPKMRDEVRGKSPTSKRGGKPPGKRIK